MDVDPALVGRGGSVDWQPVAIGSQTGADWRTRLLLWVYRAEAGAGQMWAGQAGFRYFVAVTQRSCAVANG